MTEESGLSCLLLQFALYIVHGHQDYFISPICDFYMIWVSAISANYCQSVCNTISVIDVKINLTFQEYLFIFKDVSEMH